MAFDEVIRDAVYRSPSGATFTLQFDDLERTGAKKAAIHEFPQQNIADVQDLGNETKPFQMVIYFTGQDCYARADALFSALGEPGPAALQHPRFGDISVLPLSWSQAEKWVEGVGRVDFTISFIKAPSEIPFPITGVSISDGIAASVGSATDAAIAGGAAAFNPENAADKAVTKAHVNKVLAAFRTTFSKILAVSQSIYAEANKQITYIAGNIDDLVDEPMELFDTVSKLIALPAKVETGIVRKLDAYRAHVELVTDSVVLSYSQAVAVTQTFLYEMGWASDASTLGSLKSRTEAIAAAEQLEAITEKIIVSIEGIEASVPGFRVDQDALGTLKAASSAAAESLLNRAYDLRTERRVTLASERTPIDFLFEVSGSIDALDEFIESNGLEGDEIILMKTGREVVYYG